MPVSPRETEGFALAAAVAGDRGAARARAGLSDGALEAWLVLPRALQALPAEARRRRLAALAQRTKPTPGHPPANANPRALSLLSSHVEAATGRAWLARGGLPRAGFEPDAALLQLLRSLATDPERTWRA